MMHFIKKDGTISVLHDNIRFISQFVFDGWLMAISKKQLKAISIFLLYLLRKFH